MTAGGGEDARERSRYLSAAHHELNTPLAVLRGWLETLDSMWEDLDEEDRRRGVAVSRRALDDLIGLFEAVMADVRADALARAGAAGAASLADAADNIVGRSPLREITVDIGDDLEVPFDRTVVEALLLGLAAGVAACGGPVHLSAVLEGRRTVVEARGPGRLPEDPFAPFPGGVPSLAAIRWRTARGVAAALGGEVTVATAEGEVVARAVL